MQLLKSLLQPPGLQLVLLLLALLCWFRFRQLSFFLVLVSTVSLYLLSTGYVANGLMRALEPRDVFSPAQLGQQLNEQPTAIVILGTGVLGNTPEYENQPQPGALLTQRLRYGLRLSEQTRLPVLVSGGTFYGINEAQVMANYFQNHHRQVRWQEASSRSTQENALYTAHLLKGDGYKQVVLVTHAWHMARAQKSFEDAGLKVIPAPTARAATSRSGVSAWMPDLRELRKSQLVIYEYLAMVLYRWR